MIFGKIITLCDFLTHEGIAFDRDDNGVSFDLIIDDEKARLQIQEDSSTGNIVVFANADILISNKNLAEVTRFVAELNPGIPNGEFFIDQGNKLQFKSSFEEFGSETDEDVLVQWLEEVHSNVLGYSKIIKMIDVTVLSWEEALSLVVGIRYQDPKETIN